MLYRLRPPGQQCPYSRLVWNVSLCMSSAPEPSKMLPGSLRSPASPQFQTTHHHYHHHPHHQIDKSITDEAAAVCPLEVSTAREHVKVHQVLGKRFGTCYIVIMEQRLLSPGRDETFPRASSARCNRTGESSDQNIYIYYTYIYI